MFKYRFSLEIVTPVKFDILHIIIYFCNIIKINRSRKARHSNKICVNPRAMTQRQRISIAQKRLIQEEHEKNPDETHESLSNWATREFKLSKCLDRSTISKILKEDFSDDIHATHKAKVICRYPSMERKLYEWIKVRAKFDLTLPFDRGVARPKNSLGRRQNYH